MLKILIVANFSNEWQYMTHHSARPVEASVFSNHMGESLQDYSWIQDFEADFPQKVSLKILNMASLI